MGKHAYLILCHDQWELLQILLRLLDDKRNDIYIHVDKKSKFDPKTVDVCEKSKVFLTERVRVQWGGYSVVKATMVLLKAATENGHYDYYHLLSGHDLPLKSQDEIHAFFDEHQGKEFISLKPCNHMERVKYYYPTQYVFSKNNIIGRVIRKFLLIIQKRIGVDRTKKSIFREWGIGSQFFDITDSFARYLCGNDRLISKAFHSGFIVDGMFVQTIFINSPFNEKGIRFVHPKRDDNKYIYDIYMDINRAIDWKCGSPYVYDTTDLEMLIESDCLFARKFSLFKDEHIIELIIEKIDRS